MTRILTALGTIVVLIAIIVSFISSNFTYRVDAGKVGLLIDYTHKQANGSPSVTVEPQSTFFWYNSWAGQTVTEYPIALQSLAMVAAANEGNQAGDDSVTFVTQNGIPLKVDVTTQWRVIDPAKLYFLMPGVPLDGSFNNDVSTKLIRQSVIHALNQSGAQYAWQDATSNENAIEAAMMTQLTPIMAKYGIAIEQIALGQPHYSAQQQAAINDLATAQQQTMQAQFLKQKAQYEADAAKIQAQSQAQQIEIINAQLSKSPDYLQYLLIKMYEDKWDGHLPGVVSTNSNGNIILAPFQGKQ
jgi:regulator of protease activity HflC (stomatin/prohibitin superfamily)